jgi:tetratricopeptide (TPR) repeat protein
MNKPFHKNSYLLIYALLILVTLVVYWPVLKCEFVKYDDDKRITDNPLVKSGITRESIIWLFTKPHFHMWHPLTSLSHMLDYQLFGLESAWHHLTSLLFHIAGTVLLFYILQRMTGAIWPSAFVAMAFAIHPLNVESVAWVAERMNVLSGFFWMLTIAVYIRYAQRPGICRFTLVVVVFGLSIMTKAMVVTLPFALLLLDYWPLGRLQWKRRGKQQDLSETSVEQTGSQPVGIWRLLAEKIPLFILSVVLSIITFIVQQRGGTVSDLGNVPLKYRAANALVSYVTYIRKMIWPSRLAVFYPHPFDKLPTWQVVASALLLLTVTVAVIWFARRRKYLAVGWLWFLGTRVPVIGLVQVGAQAMADRYAYLTLIGLFIMIAWGLPELLANRRYRKMTLGTLALAVLLALSICTRLQLRHWRNNKALFEHAINVTGDNFVMNNNYANVLKKMGQVEKAIDYFYKALRIRPNSPEVHNNLGNALHNLDRTDEAIKHYKKALELRPNFAETHYNLAVALAAQGKTNEAIGEYRQALRFRPDNVDTLSNLGFELAKQGNFDEAIEYYKKALAVAWASSPWKHGQDGRATENVIAHGRLGLALAGAGKIDEAIEQFQIVLKAHPDDVEMYCNMGILLEQQGKTEKAIRAYRRALQFDPDYTKAQKLLEAALAKQENQ